MRPFAMTALCPRACWLFGGRPTFSSPKDVKPHSGMGFPRVCLSNHRRITGGTCINRAGGNATRRAGFGQERTMPDRTESCIKGDIADGSVELRGRLQLAGFELAQAERDRMTPRCGLREIMPEC